MKYSFRFVTKIFQFLMLLVLASEAAAQSECHTGNPPVKIISPQDGTYTNNPYLTISGSADLSEIGWDILVQDCGTDLHLCQQGFGFFLGSGTVDSSGNWSVTSTEPLTTVEGHIITIVADKYPRLVTACHSEISKPVTVYVDVTPPLPPNWSLVNGTYQTNVLDIGGSAEKNSTVKVKRNGSEYCSAKVPDDGSGVGTNGFWNCVSNTPWPDGSYTVTATTVDRAGNQSANIQVGISVNSHPNGYTLSGKVSDAGSGVAGITIDGGPLGATTTNANGFYYFSGLANGTSFTVSPSKNGCTFNPVSSSGSIQGNDVSLNFESSAHCNVTHTISGTIFENGVEPLGNASINAGILGTTVTNIDGNYSFPNVADGSAYNIIPFKTNYTFTPPNRNGVLSTNAVVDFTAVHSAFVLNGNVVVNGNGNPISAVDISVYHYENFELTTKYGSTATTLSGGYVFNSVPKNLQSCIKASKPGYSFTPDRYCLTFASDTLVNFVGKKTAAKVSGTISLNGLGIGGVIVDGGSLGSRTTDALGQYTFDNIGLGTNVSIRPSKVGLIFSPENRTGTVLDDTVSDFSAISDSDGDGIGDLQEQTDGTNPNDRGSVLSVLSTTLCSEWNGFLGGMWNIMEHVNMSTAPVSVQTTLYSISGDPQGSRGFSIPAGAQFDLLVHDIPGWTKDSYGKVCSTVTGGNPGDLDGRMVYYKALDPAGTSYDFAFAMPFLNGTTGKQFVPFNTFQPSLDPKDKSNLVANWIQLTNLEGSAEEGTLRFYGQDGSELGVPVRVSLAGGARQDFSGHQFGPNLVGIIGWTPDNSSAKFQLRNVRYFYDNALGQNSFDTAFQLEGLVGTGEVIAVPLDTNKASAIIEVANVANTSQAISVDIYKSSGGLVSSIPLSLQPNGSIHLITDDILKGEEGVALIKGTLAEGVIAVAMQYGRTASAGLKYVYGTPARQAVGTVLRSSYNTFLNQGCRLFVVNPTSADKNATIRMTRFDATQVLSDEPIVVPKHGLIDYDLCGNEAPKNYGVVTVQAATPNSLLSSVVRLGINDDYRFPTPVRQ